MKPLALWLSAVAVLTTAAGATHADYSLSITTNADADNLQVGVPVTFDVNLSGITDSTANLSYLEATVGYDNSLLSSNPLVTPGAIIPDTSSNPNILGFVGSSFLNAADGLYDGFYFGGNTIPISTNGVFFSFQVTPLQAGDGTLSFSYAAYTLASDPDQTDQATPDTSNLNFHIDAGSPGSAVPEPPTFFLLISSLFGLSAGAGLRGLVRRVHLVK